MTAIARARILLLNPNRSTACSAGIDAAIAGFRSPAGPTIDVATVADGPPGIYSWQDWHAAVPPLCRAVAAALLRAERFGVIALVDASIARHALALRAIGAEPRLAAEIAMNTSIEALLDPLATRAALVATGQRLVERGAGAVILGCTGMAGHRAALEEALGVPVIEPCQAAVAMAIGIVVPATQQPGQQNASRAA